MSSDEDGVALMAAFKIGGHKALPRQSAPRHSRSPNTSVPHSVSEEEENTTMSRSPPRTRRLAYIRAPPVRNKSEFEYYELEDEVVEINQEYSRRGEMLYQVRLSSGKIKEVSDTKVHVREGFARGKGGNNPFPSFGSNGYIYSLACHTPNPTDIALKFNF